MQIVSLLYSTVFVYLSLFLWQPAVHFTLTYKFKLKCMNVKNDTDAPVWVTHVCKIQSKKNNIRQAPTWALSFSVEKISVQNVQLAASHFYPALTITFTT